MSELDTVKILIALLGWKFEPRRHSEGREFILSHGVDGHVIAEMHKIHNGITAKVIGRTGPFGDIRPVLLAIENFSN